MDTTVIEIVSAPADVAHTNLYRPVRVKPDMVVLAADGLAMVTDAGLEASDDQIQV